MSTKPATPVKFELLNGGDKVIIRLSAEGVPPVHIPMDAQAAFDGGEAMARMAHAVRFPHETLKSDQSYLADQIRARTTEQYRNFLVKRVELMFNSLREDKKWSNKKLAEEVVDVVVTKFA